MIRVESVYNGHQRGLAKLTVISGDSVTEKHLFVKSYDFIGRGITMGDTLTNRIAFSRHRPINSQTVCTVNILGIPLKLLINTIYTPDLLQYKIL